MKANLCSLLFTVLALLFGGATAVCAQVDSSETRVDTARVHLKGRVTDADQEPIPFVIIRVEG